MCYYSSIAVDFKIIETRFGARFVQAESFRPVYSASAFTFPQMPVISTEDPGQIVLYQWGLIPFWVKDEDSAGQIQSQTLNARAETIFTRPAFRQAVSSKRCLVLVDGFFEWRHIGNQRYPYYIREKDHQPCALAGIWDTWQDRQSSSALKTFSVITTRANSLLEQIHNTKKRMPVILPRDREKQWLDPQLDKETAASFLVPYPAEELEAYTVSKGVSRLGFNTEHPEVLREHEYPELPALKFGK